jgi:hypothetical protein
MWHIGGPGGFMSLPVPRRVSSYTVSPSQTCLASVDNLIHPLFKLKEVVSHVQQI